MLRSKWFYHHAGGAEAFRIERDVRLILSQHDNQLSLLSFVRFDKSGVAEPSFTEMVGETSGDCEQWQLDPPLWHHWNDNEYPIAVHQHFGAQVEAKWKHQRAIASREITETNVVITQFTQLSYMTATYCTSNQLTESDID